MTGIYIYGSEFSALQRGEGVMVSLCQIPLTGPHSLHRSKKKKEDGRVVFVMDFSVLLCL